MPKSLPGKNNPAFVRVDHAEKRIAVANPDVTLVRASYQGISKLATFMDREFGEFQAQVSQVISDRRRHPSCNRRPRGKTHSTKKYTIEQVQTMIPATLKILTFDGMLKSSEFVHLPTGEKFIRAPSKVMAGQIAPPSTRYKKASDSLMMTFNYVERLLKKNKPHLRIVRESYSGMGRKAKFIHVALGEFEMNCRHVVKSTGDHPQTANDRGAQTSVERYGFTCTLLNSEIAKKAKQTRARLYILKHWRDGSELLCRGSYEARYAAYLNQVKANFTWQPGAIRTPTGHYHPDCYLEDAGTFIEVKGWLQPGKQQDKIEWAKVNGYKINYLFLNDLKEIGADKLPIPKPFLKVWA